MAFFKVIHIIPHRLATCCISTDTEGINESILSGCLLPATRLSVVDDAAGRAVTPGLSLVRRAASVGSSTMPQKGDEVTGRGNPVEGFRGSQERHWDARLCDRIPPFQLLKESSVQSSPLVYMAWRTVVYRAGPRQKLTKQTLMAPDRQGAPQYIYIFYFYFIFSHSVNHT